MALSVEQLRTVPTRLQMLDFILGKLGDLGFNVTVWQSGSPQRTLMLGISHVASDFAEVAKQTIEMCFNSLATGAALEQVAIDRFGNSPKVGTKTKGNYRLTNSGAVPYTLTVGQLRVATATNIEFTLVALPNGATLAAGGTLDVTIEAVKAGLAGNVAANTITSFKTPLAGVTGTNPAGGGNTPWYTTSGEDPESDAALRLRNSTRFATQSVERIRDAYVQIALQASDSIRRCEVDDNNPRGEGTVDVYIAGDAGPVGTTEVTAAQNAFAIRVWRTDTYPPNNTTSRVVVQSVSSLAVDITGTIYFSSSYAQATVQAKVEAAIQAFLRSVPVGGYPYPTPGNKLPKNEIENAIRAVAGVKTVVLSAPAADTDLSTFQVPVLGALSLTYTSVSG